MLDKILLELKWKYLYKFLRNIKLLILDVDGVLTDGGLWVNHKGETIKRFDVKDGMGLKLLQEIGINILLISGGSSGALEERAKQLGISNFYVNIKDKGKLICKFQKNKAIPVLKTAYIGDDINDIVVRPFVKLLFTPKDASIFLKNKSDMVLSKLGGKGAVRELTDRILISKGIYDNFTKKGWIGKNN